MFEIWNREPRRSHLKIREIVHSSGLMSRTNAVDENRTNQRENATVNEQKNMFEALHAQWK